MKIILNLFIVLSISAFMTSCDKDPYPQDGNLRTIQNAATVEPTSALPLIISPEVQISEGREMIEKIIVDVPPPGKPIVEVDNLPAGAIFDKENLLIKWRPGFRDGNDPQDPTIKTRRYTIQVTLFTDETDRSGEGETKDMTVTVADVPQAFEIDSASYENVVEGDTLVYDFEIKNEDYPQGPFDIYSSDIPANAKLERIDSNNFRLVYSPDFHHVKLNENAVSCSGSTWGSKECFVYKGKITATNPAGHKVEKEIEIRVRDKRQDVKLSVPDDMIGGLDVSFSVSAVDPNGEIAPVIKYDGNDPEFGEFSTKLIRDEVNNFSVLHVSWTDIPPTNNGKLVGFEFDSCVLSSSSSVRSCESKDFSVLIKVKERKAPVFSREDWKAGEIKYLRHSASLSTSIEVEDGDTFTDVTRVEVLPKSMQKYISYNNGTLSVAGVTKAGLHQFSLSAISEYNVSSAESFVFEVFDKKRSETLYFTDSTRDAEVVFYRDTMKNVELMNPVLQKLSERNLSGRKNLIIGTGILADPERKDDIAMAMKKIQNVVIASPLIGNMPDDFLRELQRDFRVSITGRYSDISGAPELSKMYFVARSDLPSARGKIGLKLTTSPESANPLIFSVGVDRKNCQDVLDFTDQGTESLFKMGVICDRRLGGRYVILGTEFADLKTSVINKSIPAKWLRRMLSTSLNPRSSK